MSWGKFLRQLNQSVALDGKWINFGSLVFNQGRDGACYSIEEVKLIAEDCGFDIHDIREHELPYLQSPYNAGYRMERVWTWSATKVADVPALENPQVLPEWLLDTAKAVPKASYLASFSSVHKLYAALVDDVDGKVSIDLIGKKLAKYNNMAPAEAIELVRKFFTDLHQQNS